MKKLGKFVKTHRVFTILMAVVLVCVILIATVLFRLFYDSKKGMYGDRLEGIEKVKLEEKRLKEIEDKILAEQGVLVSKVRVQGKIVYIHMTGDSTANIEGSKAVAQRVLDNFSDEEKNYYDFHFTIKKASTEKDDGFLIEGAKNKNGSGLVWNNNRPVTTPIETDGQ